MKKPPSPLAYTLFCDDIRHEKDFKFSAMGVYQTALVLGEKELELAKFVALTVLQVPSEVAGQRGSILLLDRETVLIKGEFVIPSPPDGAPVGRQFMMSIPIEAIPFAASAGMELQVQFEAGTFSYASSILRVIESSDVHSLELENQSAAEASDPF